MGAHGLPEIGGYLEDTEARTRGEGVLWPREAFDAETLRFANCSLSALGLETMESTRFLEGLEFMIGRAEKDECEILEQIREAADLMVSRQCLPVRALERWIVSRR